ncbi:helix-turn-helix transcriptional regulator [Novosphingobium colocasiae]|uniref:HTH luxR-type domain-containing protein n=1 Tax=Novosphingobium colocasiae TaxID=1256513 RepID=A0A918UE84_9SPHN|nr:helix-turn-helix transcriptional regulator [Novosphingobium colocasiae]GGY96360.1 hypothetical protein GCM10011614_08960 [Novosphingobium colocasiae]
MALTGTEETDLLLPLLSGGLQEHMFPLFLKRLHRRTHAQHVALVLRRDSETGRDPVIAFAGDDIDGRAIAAGESPYHLRNRTFYEQLRPGRVYAISELIEHDLLARAERARALRPLATVDERVVRLTGEEDWAGWLVLTRTTRCRAEDSALVSSLVPYLNAAIDQRETLDRIAREARLAAAGMARSGTGWVLFDRDARIAAIDHATRACWTDLHAAAPRIGERLIGLAPAVQRRLAAITAAQCDNPTHPAQAITLNDDPRIEALLSPAPGEAASGPDDRRILAVCRLPRRGGSSGAARFATVHALPLREAELALGLADGLSLPEAGAALGLTLETTRNYSKRLYAKLDVRGQAELVRLVYEGTALYA